jgi:nuclear transport factor 2 (NTF2) superfamily protein
MENQNNLPAPPWDMETAAARLKLLENDYNSQDPVKISENFTENAEVRFGTAFLTGREAIKNHLAEDFAKRKSYKLNLDLWGALKGRMAVRFEIDWTDETNKAFKSYGVTVFQFTDESLIEMNFASSNDHSIK